MMSSWFAFLPLVLLALSCLSSITKVSAVASGNIVKQAKEKASQRRRSLFWREKKSRMIENGGEDKKKWQGLIDQQLSLERAGRACLRVDCMSVVCNGSATLKNLFGYLDAKLPVSAGDKRSSDVTALAAPAATAQMHQQLRWTQHRICHPRCGCPASRRPG